jgi:hypothetical protein
VLIASSTNKHSWENIENNHDNINTKTVKIAKAKSECMSMEKIAMHEYENARAR